MNSFKLTLLLISTFFLCCSESGLYANQWKISYNKKTKGIEIKKNSVVLMDDLYASFKAENKEITTKDYSKPSIKKKEINNEFGKGVLYEIQYKTKDLPDLIQLFYVYPEKDYLLTEFNIGNNTGTISSNYMAPVNTSQLNSLPGSTNDKRALFIPFDNDCWIRYQSHPLNFNSLTSYEVTTVFDNTSRNGYVIGSVEHDNWKSAVKLASVVEGKQYAMTCYGGVADSLTRDSKPHGFISGNNIKSPKVFIGFFDDWRNGLDEYANANAIVSPPLEWNKALPFGWNSWGVLQFGLTYQKALEVSDYFKDHLQNNHFVNQDNTVIIGLDSGWNSFTEDELKSFVRKCKENGQIAGVYWTPFTDWGKRPESKVHDADEYQYKDIYIYANGKPQELDGAFAIDPTHPAIEKRMKKTSDLFRRCGFEYVKMDFMTHGAMEGDKWYLPEIQTGIQAYNYGMKLINQYFGDMYLNLSISPIFPANYAQSRRIACDAWNKIKDTEYTMNAVSYGWWIDKVYQYNDADHIVLKDATEGENRARVTSAVITGLYIAGDDLSKDGPEDGKERSRKYLTNQSINRLANGITFRPLEGNGEKSENQFVRFDDKGLYYVVFNYSENPLNITIPINRLEIDGDRQYKAVELWSDSKIDIHTPLNVPGKDVKIIRIDY